MKSGLDKQKGLSNKKISAFWSHKDLSIKMKLAKDELFNNSDDGKDLNHPFYINHI